MAPKIHKIKPRAAANKKRLRPLSMKGSFIKRIADLRSIEIPVILAWCSKVILMRLQIWANQSWRQWSRATTTRIRAGNNFISNSPWVTFSLSTRSNSKLVTRSIKSIRSTLNHPCPQTSRFLLNRPNLTSYKHRAQSNSAVRWEEIGIVYLTHTLPFSK